MFTNTVKVEWLPDDPRKMRLLEDVVFISDQGVQFCALKGDIIDGASIPRFFWRLVGSPFVGKYRRATVLHDVYCENKIWGHKQIHKMFYDAMIDDGVSKTKAKIMYRAVKMFGPKW